MAALVAATGAAVLRARWRLLRRRWRATHQTPDFLFLARRAQGRGGPPVVRSRAQDGSRALCRRTPEYARGAQEAAGTAAICSARWSRGEHAGARTAVSGNRY